MLTRTRDFFLFCSGTDLNVLHKCPTETVNRVGIGAAVLFTATISTTAFFCHMTQVYHCSWVKILPLGLVWGLGIFSLDRWLVGTMRVGNSPREALRSSWMRLCLACLFGAFASDALVLQTFEPEIN